MRLSNNDELNIYVREKTIPTVWGIPFLQFQFNPQIISNLEQLLSKSRPSELFYRKIVLTELLQK